MLVHSKSAIALLAVILVLITTCGVFSVPVTSKYGVVEAATKHFKPTQNNYARRKSAYRNKNNYAQRFRKIKSAAKYRKKHKGKDDTLSKGSSSFLTTGKPMRRQVWFNGATGAKTPRVSKVWDEFSRLEERGLS